MIKHFRANASGDKKVGHMILVLCTVKADTSANAPSERNDTNTPQIRR